MEKIRTPIAQLPQSVLNIGFEKLSWMKGSENLVFFLKNILTENEKLEKSCDLLAQAKILCKKGSFAKAIPLLEESLIYYPNQSDANLYLAQIYYDQKNWIKSVENFRKTPRAKEFFEYGYALKKIENHTEAYQVFHNLASKNNLNALIELGKICHTLGKYKEALKHYNQALKLNPNLQRVCQLKGITENSLEAGA